MSKNKQDVLDFIFGAAIAVVILLLLQTLS
jgi:hypothetical protein